MKQIGTTGIAVSSALIPIGWVVAAVALVSVTDNSASDEQRDQRTKILLASVIVPPTLLATSVCIRIIYR